MYTPLVSICCITYNHAPYIRECLDGFMMQKTKFPIEIIINDDASTDGTTEIIKEYEAQYPDIIKPIYQVENQYSKGVRGMYANFCFPRAQGKYIALCEGDDYWTDPLKLQKQVDFLESHPDYVMCSHRFKLYIQKDNNFSKDWYSTASDVEYGISDLIRGTWYHHPLSVMFRSDKLDLQEHARYPYTMDAVLFFHLLKKGPGIMLNEDMAVYRIHFGGIWSGINQENRLKNEFKARIGLYDVEKNYEAAFFLRHQFAKCFGRKWMLQEWKIMMKSFKIISKHFGCIYTSKLYLKKILFNQGLKY